MLVQTELVMISELRKVLKRLHYPLELELELEFKKGQLRCPGGRSMSAAQQFYSLAF